MMRMIIVRAGRERTHVIFFRKGLGITVIENTPQEIIYVAAVKERGWNSCLFFLALGTKLEQIVTESTANSNKIPV